MVPWASKETIIWRLQVQSSLQASHNTGILNTCTRLWITESERATPPRGFNKGRSSKFREGSRVRQLRRTCRPKRCGNNNKHEDNSPKTLNDKKTAVTFYTYQSFFWVGGGEQRKFSSAFSHSDTTSVNATRAVEYTNCNATEGIRPHSNECPVHDTKPSDGEALGNVEYLFTDITSKSNLIWSDRLC